MSRLAAVAAALVHLALAPADASSSEGGERCGTWRQVGPALSSAAAARPSPGVFQTATTHFIVHYGSASLASYAQDVADAAELTYRVLVDTLLFNAPPSDGAQGGDARTDIYLEPSLGGAWGSTFFETLVGSPYVNSYSSWVEIVDTLSFDRRRTVTAHEVFHVVQLGYDGLETVSFLEMISTWVEDRIYDDVNLYLEVLPQFFSQPSKGLYTFTYSNVPWMIFLAETYGDGIVRDILDGCASVGGPNITASTDAALAPHGSSQIDALGVFTLWNFLTGARDDGEHYTEGAAFPTAFVEKHSDCVPFSDYATAHKMNQLGCNYFLFDGNGATDSLRLRIAPEWFAQTVVTVHRFKPGVLASESRTIPTFTLRDSVTVADWSECDSLLVVFQIATTTQSFSDLTVSAHYTRTAPPADPYVLVLDRDACRAPFDGVGDEFGARDGEEAPFADALGSLGLRVVLSDSIPHDLTMCGGVFVVGGTEGFAPNIGESELAQLMAFMDGGGDVYVEGSELGLWVSTPTETAFWGYFGASYSPGNPMAVGNVSSWRTLALGPVGEFEFDYDFQEPPDDNVGVLVPGAADTLGVDQSGVVRATVMNGPNESTRIMSTVLLGGSTAMLGTREAFVSAVVDLFDSIVDALAVASMRVFEDGARVRIEGVLEGYGGETLRLRRRPLDGPGAVDVALSVVADHSRALLGAVDEPPPGPVVYRLDVVGAGGDARLLWQQTVAARAVARPLALVNAYPNPARDRVTLVLESDRAQAVTIGVYNAAGERVLDARAVVGVGVNTVPLDGAERLVSGVYFVRAQAAAAAGVVAHRKLHILR